MLCDCENKLCLFGQHVRKKKKIRLKTCVWFRKGGDRGWVGLGFTPGPPTHPMMPSEFMDTDRQYQNFRDSKDRCGWWRQLPNHRNQAVK